MKKDTGQFKKPAFVLTNETRFYLATQNITNTDETNLYMIASLYLPVRKDGISLAKHIEVAAFDDSTSADIYHDTVSAMCRVNAQSDTGQEYKKEIARFNNTVFFAENDQER